MTQLLWMSSPHLIFLSTIGKEALPEWISLRPKMDIKMWYIARLKTCTARVQLASAEPEFIPKYSECFIWDIFKLTFQSQQSTPKLETKCNRTSKMNLTFAIC